VLAGTIGKKGKDRSSIQILTIIMIRTSVDWLWEKHQMKTVGPTYDTSDYKTRACNSSD